MVNYKSPMIRKLPGYIALSALVVVLSLGFFIGADILSVSRTIKTISAMENQATIKSKLDGSIQNYLKTNASWLGDSVEPVDKYGVSLYRTDLSARLNVNWINPFILASPNLSAYFPKGISSFEEFRRKNGPFNDANQAKDFITPSFFSKLGTLSGPIDLNTCDEIVIENILNQRGAQGAYVRSVLQANRSKKSTLSQKDLESLLGIKEFQSHLYTDNAGINVLSASEELIAAILSHPSWQFSTTKIETMVKALMEIQKSSQSPKVEHLSTLLELEKNHLVLQYFNTESNTFQLEAISGKDKLIVTVLRLGIDPTKTGNYLWKIMRREYRHG